MRQVIARQVCERHPLDIAAWPEPFIFLNPINGKWYAIDPCEADAETIMTALGPFIDIVKGERECPPRTGDPASTSDSRSGHSVPPMRVLPIVFDMPPGSHWGAAKSASGHLRNHLTRNDIDSLCSYISDSSSTQFVSDLVEGAPFCRKCVDRGMPKSSVR